MKIKLLLLIIFSFVFCNSIFGVMANPKVTKAKQPDGTTIDIRLMGDEFYSWNEDVDGYTIIKDTQTATGIPKIYKTLSVLIHSIIILPKE